MEFSEVSFLTDCTRPGPSSRLALQPNELLSPCKVDLDMLGKADGVQLERASNAVAFVLARHLREYFKISFVLEIRRFAACVYAAMVIQRAYRAYASLRNNSLRRRLRHWKAFEEQAKQAKPASGALSARRRSSLGGGVGWENATQPLWELLGGLPLSNRMKLAIILRRHRELMLEYIRPTAPPDTSCTSSGGNAALPSRPAHPIALPSEEFFLVARSGKSEWLAQLKPYLTSADALWGTLHSHHANETPGPSLSHFGPRCAARKLMKRRPWLTLSRPAFPGNLRRSSFEPRAPLAELQPEVDFPAEDSTLTQPDRAFPAKIPGGDENIDKLEVEPALPDLALKRVTRGARRPQLSQYPRWLSLGTLRACEALLNHPPQCHCGTCAGQSCPEPLRGCPPTRSGSPFPFNLGPTAPLHSIALPPVSGALPPLSGRPRHSSARVKPVSPHPVAPPRRHSAGLSRPTAPRAAREDPRAGAEGVRRSSNVSESTSCGYASETTLLPPIR
eukprot:RCo054779